MIENWSITLQWTARKSCVLRAASALILVGGVVSFRADAQTFRGLSVDEWTKALEGEDVRERWYATLALAQIGPDANGATTPLMRLLADRGQYEYVRAGAALALGKIQAEPDRAVPLLTETLGSELASVRRHSARALGRFGVQAAPAVPQMLAELRDDDAVFRIELAEALWHVARHERAIPFLVDQARRASDVGGFEAVESLGRLAEENPQLALPALVEALGSNNADVARSAARSLGRMGASAIASLSEAASSERMDVRRGTIEAYAWMGPAGASGLIVGLNDAAPEVRRAAARGLGGLGPAVAASEPALLRAVNDSDRRVRETAAAALKRIGAGSP